MTPQESNLKHLLQTWRQQLIKPQGDEEARPRRCLEEAQTSSRMLLPAEQPSQETHAKHKRYQSIIKCTSAGTHALLFLKDKIGNNCISDLNGNIPVGSGFAELLMVASCCPKCSFNSFFFPLKSLKFQCRIIKWCYMFSVQCFGGVFFCPKVTPRLLHVAVAAADFPK